MTSEKLSKDNLKKLAALQTDMAKHRLWLIALSTLIFLLAYVLLPLILLVHERNLLLVQESHDLQYDLLNMALQMYGLDSALSYVVAPLAVLFALAGFAFLYRMNTLDFYESEPFTRLQRYMLICVNNLLIFTPILVVSTVIAMLFTLLFGGVRLLVYFEIVFQMMRLFLLFFSVNGIATLAAVLSGNLVIAVLLTTLFTLAELFIRLLFMACGETYFTTLNQTLNVFGYFGGFTSPLVFDTLHIYGNGYAFTMLPTSKQLVVYASVVPYLAIMGVIGLIGFTAAYFAYRNRKLENTGRGLCYPIAESVVKIVIAVVVGGFSGIIIDSTVGTVHKNVSPVFWLIVVLSVALTCGVGEVIFAKNIRAVKKRAWQIPVCVAICFVLLYSYKFDVYGYDSYVPNPSEVKSAALSHGQIYYDSAQDSGTSLPDARTFGMQGMESVLMRMQLTGDQVNALCEAAKSAMAKQRHYAIFASIYEGDISDQEYDFYDVSVVYRLKNGREVTRHMAIPHDIDSSLMDRIINTEEYRAGRFDLDGFESVIRDDDYMKKSAATAIYEYGGVQDSTSLDREHAIGLAEAYRADAKMYGFSFAKANRSIGTLNFEVRTRWEYAYDYYSDGLPIYPEFKKTIAYLKELDIYHDPSYEPEEVDHFVVYRSEQPGYDWDLYNEDENTVEYVKREQVEALCRDFLPDTYVGDWYRDKGDDDRLCVNAVLNDKYESYVYGYIERNKAPAFLKKDVSLMEETE